jgi:TM2 domain-containing membrane protein YozV
MQVPRSLRDGFGRLPDEVKIDVQRAYKRRHKSLSTAYVLWLLLGFHYVYLGRAGTQIIFSLTLGGLLVWWLLDLFRLPGMLRTYNEDVARDLMVKHKALSDG